MKKMNLFAAMAVITLMFTACKNEKTGDNTSTVVDRKQEVWAEQIECDVKTIKPDDWADEDWNKAVTGVDRKKIYNTILDAVLSGKQKAYNYMTNAVLTVDEIKNMMNHTDTVLVQNQETGELKPVVEKTEIGPDDFTFIKVREKWLFDAETFRLTTVPVQMIICTNVYGEDGELRGQKALFYIKLN